MLVVTGLAGQRGRDLPVIILNERGSAVLTVLQLKGGLNVKPAPLHPHPHHPPYEVRAAGRAAARHSDAMKVSPKLATHARRF